MLTSYLTRTKQLLQNPMATAQLYTDTDLTSYINSARGQLAGETECVRNYATLTLAYGVNTYAFSAFTTAAGIAGIFNIRGATVAVANGQIWMHPRPFPYFQLYFLNNPVPQLGRPTTYSQFGQGETGSFYVAPSPDYGYAVSADCVCVPSALATDGDTEVIPYPYTDAVPYYAAHLAFMSAQRAADADRLWQEYQKFAGRARQMSNGPVNPTQYPQGQNPVRSNQLGVQAQQSRSGG